MKKSRRNFIKNLGAGSMLVSGSLWNKAFAEEYMHQHILPFELRYSASDTIRLGVIGCGIQGNSDLEAALKVPGVEMAGACD